MRWHGASAVLLYFLVRIQRKLCRLTWVCATGHAGSARRQAIAWRTVRSGGDRCGSDGWVMRVLRACVVRSKEAKRLKERVIRVAREGVLSTMLGGHGHEPLPGGTVSV